MNKLYYIFLVLFIFTLRTLQAQYIKWSADTPLTWGDFLGHTDGDDSSDAHTHIIINYSYRYDKVGDIYKLTFIIYGGFDKTGSWVRKGHESNRLLKHEQLHFDISELFMRKLYIMLSSQTYTSDYKQEVKDVFAVMMRQLKATQENYDINSDHSRDADNQQKWEKIIQQELKQTPAYPN